ncbi:hypothetical protein DFQ26_006185 [Actinomortierella ambigua]|nr:hypothetical protein DFQ26_006185 [Actinomortierella ambigua]
MGQFDSPTKPLNQELPYSEASRGISRSSLDSQSAVAVGGGNSSNNSNSGGSSSSGHGHGHGHPVGSSQTLRRVSSKLDMFKQGLSKKGSRSKFATVATTTSPWSATTTSLHQHHYSSPNSSDIFMTTATTNNTTAATTATGTAAMNGSGDPVPSMVAKPGMSESVSQYDFGQFDRWYGNDLSDGRMTFNVVEQQESGGKVQERDVAYSIRVECSAKIMLLSRRISDFVDFDKKVKAQFPKARPALPPLDDQRKSFLATTRQLFFPRKNTAEKLEGYLYKVASHPPLCRSEIFQEFLAVSEEGDLMHAKDNRFGLRDSLQESLPSKVQKSIEDFGVPSGQTSSNVGSPPQQSQQQHQQQQQQQQQPPSQQQQQQHLYNYSHNVGSYQSQMPPLPPPPQQQHHDYQHYYHDYQHYHQLEQQQQLANLYFSPLPPSGQSLYAQHQQQQPMMATETHSVPRGRGGKVRPGIPVELQQQQQQPQQQQQQQQQHLALPQQALANRKIGTQDFDFCTVLGGGCMGKVFLVRDKQSKKLFALKVISKEWVILQREIEHTKSERNILANVAKISHPFLIKLRHSFQDQAKLFMVFDFYPGGDIATQLSNCHKFEPPRCLFYTAEIVLGIEELHRLGIVYRDLKPENILLAMDGHIVLTDFGLSKQFPSLNGSNNGYVNNEKTSTFCGTAEYLAPEILLAYEYSYEVDWWSLGTLLFEMLSGVTPFWAENHATMYRRVLEDELEFPLNIDPDARSFISGLLERDPVRRLGYGSNGARVVKRHPYFKGIDWHQALQRRLPCPYVPELTSEEDLRNFDDIFLTMTPQLSPGNHTLSNSIQNCFQGYSYTMASSALPAGGTGGTLPRTDSKMQTSTAAATGAGGGGPASVQSSYKDHLMNHGPTPHQGSYRGAMHGYAGVPVNNDAPVKPLRPAAGNHNVNNVEDPRLAPMRAQPSSIGLGDGPFTDVDMNDGDDVVMQEGQDGDMEEDEECSYGNGQHDADRVHQDLLGYKLDDYHHLAHFAYHDQYNQYYPYDMTTTSMNDASQRAAGGGGGGALATRYGSSQRNNSGGSGSSTTTTGGYVPPSAAIAGVETKGQATVDMHVRRSSSATSSSSAAAMALMSCSPSVARHSVQLTGLNIINGGLSSSSPPPSVNGSGGGGGSNGTTALMNFLPGSPTTPTMATTMNGGHGGKSLSSSSSPPPPPSSSYSPPLALVPDDDGDYVDEDDDKETAGVTANGHVIAVVTTTLSSGNSSAAANILRGLADATGQSGGGISIGGPRNNSTSSSRSSDTIGGRLSRSFL